MPKITKALRYLPGGRSFIMTSRVNQRLGHIDDDPRIPYDSPQLGLVNPDLEVISVSFEEAPVGPHHVDILRPFINKGWCEAKNLRFSVNTLVSEVHINGDPTLNPFFDEKNFAMIKTMSKHLVEEGTPKDLDIRVEKQLMGSPYERRIIGKIKDYI